MAGLDPAIPAAPPAINHRDWPLCHGVDGRDKPGHDGDGEKMLHNALILQA